MSETARKSVRLPVPTPSSSKTTWRVWFGEGTISTASST
jgi:hypothetical protein